MRNSLDTVASMKKVKFPLTIPSVLEERIAFYLRYVNAGLRFGADYPDRYFRVVYEQLVASPRPVLTEMMAFLEETLEEGQLKFNESFRQPGLEDPKIAGTRRTHDEAVGQWRKTLTRDEARTVWRKTRRLWEILDPNGRFDRLSIGCVPPSLMEYCIRPLRCFMHPSTGPLEAHGRAMKKLDVAGQETRVQMPHGGLPCSHCSQP